MVNGAGGRFLRSLRLTSVTTNAASLSAATISVAAASLWMAGLCPSSLCSSASNAWPSLSHRAVMLQYSWATNFPIASSRSTISRSATVCTRPAERPVLIAFHSSGLTLKPTSRSRIRRAIWASTFFASMVVGRSIAAAIASLVISWNRTRLTLPLSFPTASLTCQAIASPSRSGSVAIRIRSASFAALLSSAIAFCLPLTVVNFGANCPSTSTPSSRSGKSRMWPTVAFTVKPFPRYLPIVFAFAGDSTTTSVCLPSAMSFSLLLVRHRRVIRRSLAYLPVCPSVPSAGRLVYQPPFVRASSATAAATSSGVRSSVVTVACAC